MTDSGEATLWTANWVRQSGRQRITGSFDNAAVDTGASFPNMDFAVAAVRRPDRGGCVPHPPQAGSAA